MSFFEDASLVMIPSGVKDGKLYSIKPTDGNGDFTFTRGTDTATRVNSAGIIEKETQNLLLQSNQFDTTWVSSNTTETGGQSGYDGTSDAWLLSKTSGYANLNQSVSASGVNTYSVYAKANTLNWIRIVGGSTSAFFDLNNGVVGSTDAGNIAKMTSIGSGWYRCEVAMNASTTIMRIYPADGDNDVSGSSGSIYIQDAQLEQSLVARTYIETTTAAVYAGITDNLPRLDYSGGASCPSLLLEPQRTNVLSHSEYFGGWSQINTINTANALISPEGVQNANKLIAASGVNNNVIYQGLTAGTYTASVFAKKGEFEGIIIATGTVGAFFNLNTNSFRANYQNAPTSYNIEDYGNGWHRYSITFTLSGNDNFYIGPNDNVSNTLGVTGNNSNGIYIYGAQLEAGSYATSYIPTMGVSATRAADVCTGGGSAASINSTEGVLYWECSALNNDVGTTRVLSISDGSSTNSLYTGYNSTSNLVQAQLLVGGSAQTNMTHLVSDRTEFIKVAVLYKSNDHKMYINGVEVETDTSGSVPSANTFDTFNFDLGQGSFDFYGNIKQVAVFNGALTDSELTALTTL